MCYTSSISSSWVEKVCVRMRTRNKSKSCGQWGLRYQHVPVNGLPRHMAASVMWACVNTHFAYLSTNYSLQREQLSEEKWSAVMAKLQRLAPNWSSTKEIWLRGKWIGIKRIWSKHTTSVSSTLLRRFLKSAGALLLHRKLELPHNKRGGGRGGGPTQWLHPDNNLWLHQSEQHSQGEGRSNTSTLQCQ